MQVQLIITDKQRSGQAIPVDVPAFRIGQAEDCHLRSSSSRISPQHCVIHTHSDRVTVLDLGGENGTYVNGERISSQRELKDGDKLTVGRHSFALSIKAGTDKASAELSPASHTSHNETFELADDLEPSGTRSVDSGEVDSDEAGESPDRTAMQSDPESVQSEQDAEIMFEVRYKGQNVSVTKKRLFEMARQGAVSPDDIITVAGTKVFADSVHGIVFGNESPADIATTGSKTQGSRPYAAAPGVSAHDPFESSKLEKSATGSHSYDTLPPPNDSTSVEGSTPFDTANEPSIQIGRVPGARKEMTFSDLGKPLEEPLSQASTWMSNNITRRHVTIAGSVLAGCCLLGALVFWLMPDEQSSYGAVRITGTLTLDGVPVVGAGVILHPRDEQGHAARGATDSRGRFVVATGTDTPGRGAVPGEYDVTFFKRPEIPSRYEAPETSRLILRVEPTGGNSFPFALTSTAEASAVPQNVAAQDAAATGTASSQAATDEETVAVLQPPTVAVEAEPEPELPPTPTPPAFPDIWAAAARGTPQDVETFLRDGVSVNERDDAGNTPLHFAAQSNPNENVLRHLISRQADGYARNHAGDTPLDVANTAAKSRILLDALAPPPPQIRNIIEAAARGTAQHVEFFVRRGVANVNQRDTSNQLGNLVIHVAAESNPDAAVLEYLINQGADVNARNNTSNTPLHLAARRNPNVEVLRHLIDRGADVNARNESGETPWDFADPNVPEKRVLIFQRGGRGGGGQ